MSITGIQSRTDALLNERNLNDFAAPIMITDLALEEMQ